MAPSGKSLRMAMQTKVHKERPNKLVGKDRKFDLLEKKSDWKERAALERKRKEEKRGLSERIRQNAGVEQFNTKMTSLRLDEQKKKFVQIGSKKQRDKKAKDTKGISENKSTLAFVTGRLGCCVQKIQRVRDRIQGISCSSWSTVPLATLEYEIKEYKHLEALLERVALLRKAEEKVALRVLLEEEKSGEVEIQRIYDEDGGTIAELAISGRKG